MILLDGVFDAKILFGVDYSEPDCSKQYYEKVVKNRLRIILKPWFTPSVLNIALIIVRN